MRHTLTIPEGTYQRIEEHLSGFSTEAAGFAFARTSRTEDELRMLVREYQPVDSSYVLHADRVSMTIESTALIKAMKHADETGQCLLFVHSHPNGETVFSDADNGQEPALFKAAYNRNDSMGPHASLVLPRDAPPFARVWKADGQSEDISRIRVVGKAFRFFDKLRTSGSTEFFDRQVRAFGRETQELLASLHVAVVGAGGTGSATVEQLVRLGIGKLSLYDGQALEKSNVSRVFGSRASDHGRKKVKVLAKWAKQIGLGTNVIAHPQHITCEQVAKTLRDADVIFGCTDDQWGRSVLNDLAIRYFIPVIDMGVKIPSDGGVLHSVCGRVTVLAPGNACLFCRGRLSPARIKAESDASGAPDEAAALRKEGYAPELEEPDPSVIPFTTAMASLATAELLHRLTGFMGKDRKSSEVLHFFERNEIRTNAEPQSPQCQCAQTKRQGAGDTADFLGMLWR